jgi:hypothetical protein
MLYEKQGVIIRIIMDTAISLGERVIIGKATMRIRNRPHPAADLAIDLALGVVGR